MAKSRENAPYGPCSRYIIPTTMDTHDPAGEFLRISEHYRRMSDDELLLLIPQSSELTPLAQQALASEARSRGLQAEVEAEKPPGGSPFKPPPAFFEHESPKLRESASYGFPDAETSYDEDRKLVELCTVWSVRDALKVQTILDSAGIPFFMGKEKAPGVDEVTSNFANGVSVRIMQVGLPWAAPGMVHYMPEDEPGAKESDEAGESTIRCPKCHSAEVIFEGGTSTQVIAADDSSQKFKWTCDSCGHHWEDDGVAKDR